MILNASGENGPDPPSDPVGNASTAEARLGGMRRCGDLGDPRPRRSPLVVPHAPRRTFAGFCRMRQLLSLLEHTLQTLSLGAYLRDPLTQRLRDFPFACRFQSHKLSVQLDQSWADLCLPGVQLPDSRCDQGIRLERRRAT